jgi:hypothetical protein
MNTARLRVLMVVAVPALALGAEAGGLVTPIPKPYAIEGCAWSASSQSLGSGFIYLAELDDSVAIMRIDGVDVELQLVEAHGRLDKVSDVLEKKYRSGSHQVKARYVATWVCPENNESCEVTKYTVRFEVSKGQRTQVIEATGDVGC